MENRTILSHRQPEPAYFNRLFKKSFVLVTVVMPAPFRARDKLRRVSSNLLKRLDSRSLLTACWDKLHGNDGKRLKSYLNEFFNSLSISNPSNNQDQASHSPCSLYSAVSCNVLNTGALPCHDPRISRQHLL